MYNISSKLAKLRYFHLKQEKNLQAKEFIQMRCKNKLPIQSHTCECRSAASLNLFCFFHFKEEYSDLSKTWL